MESQSRITRSKNLLLSPIKSPHVPTPEKQPHPPRRRAVARSLKDVKRVASRGLLVTSAPPAGPTPADLDLPHPNSPAKLPKPRPQIHLIDKYEMLVEFFNCMVSSIQLLKLRGTMSTFTNICASIQNLTERKFGYGHLAQMKYVFSEAVFITKVVVRDEVTCCMKPELQVALDVEAVGEGLRRKGESGFLALRRVFRERLVDFSNSHPQGDDVPQEVLPHPFNQTKEILPPKVERVLTDSVPAEPLPVAPSLLQPAGPSHISRSFKPCFSQRKTTCEPKTPLLCLDKETAKVVDPISAIAPTRCVSGAFTDRKSSLGLPTAYPSPSKQGPLEKNKSNFMRDENRALEDFRIEKRTPDKHSSSPVRLMTSTPELQTPKRSRLSICCDSPEPVKSEKRSTRTKLFRTPIKDEKKEDKTSEPACSSFVDDDVLRFLPKKLLQSIQEKERKALEEKEAGVDEAKRRQKVLARLPNMFDTILLIVQSTQQSTMTKQELIHKIIASNTKIVDKGEAEEQLKLLQELVPDYIFEKLALSGDTLCCINKMSSPEEIRRRLAEAI